ncbi:hypothetical protein ElyMa_004215400, partial [Elysia marginata]
MLFTRPPLPHIKNFCANEDYQMKSGDIRSSTPPQMSAEQPRDNSQNVTGAIRSVQQRATAGTSGMSSSLPSSMRKPHRSRQVKQLRLPEEDSPLCQSYFLGKLKDYQKIPFARLLASPEANQTHHTLIKSVINKTACPWFNGCCNTLPALLEARRITGETIAPRFSSSRDIIIIGLAYMQKMLEILSCEPLPDDKLQTLVEAIKQ